MKLKSWSLIDVGVVAVMVLVIVPLAVVAAVPSTVTGLVARQTDAAVVLTWNPAKKGVAFDAYAVYRSERSGRIGTVIGRVEKDVRTFTDNTVKAKRTYYYRIGYYRGKKAVSPGRQVRVSVKAVPPKKEAVVPPPPSAATSTAALPCALAPLQRQFSDAPYYSGTLFDAHFHMPQLRKITGEHASAPVLDQDVSKRDVACLFGSGRVTGAFAFYGIPSDLKDAGVNAARDIEQKYPGTLKHFLELVTFPGYPVVPAQIEAVLNANAGLFKGYGEFSLYLPHYAGVSPNDPAMRELYAIAEKNNLVVMMHPLEGQQQAVEQVLRDFPSVKFLFHALERVSWANTFFDTDLDRYPNAYYSVDIDLFGQDANGRPFMDSARDKQDFTTQFKQRWQSTLSQKVSYWKAKIEKHPNQFLWGTDRGVSVWNYDPEVGSLLEEYSRAFIGQLDAAVQEKYAHANAEQLLNR